ncbi:hypothetical protein KKC60_04130, partial [Patescibacteria group bacterium]|nr:hypothetical protein [Patescibacteria group bacterium]
KDGGLFYPRLCFMFTLVSVPTIVRGDKEGSCHLKIIGEVNGNTPLKAISFAIPGGLVEGKLTLVSAGDDPHERKQLRSIEVDDKSYTRSFIENFSEFEQE